MDQEMRELADASADDGFRVAVPDIFWLQIPGPTANIGVALERYAWVNPTFFVGEGRVLPGLGVEYRVWRPA